MRGALHVLRELDDDLLARWHHLAARALEPNPFYAPALALPAAHWLAGGEDDRLLAVHDGAALRLALPVRRVARYRRVPVPTWLGWGHAHSYLDTPLVAPGAAAAAFTAALDVLAGDGAAWLVLEHAPADGAVRAALDAALASRRSAAVTLGEHARPVVHRRPDPSYLDGRLSSARRKRLRRQRRGLAGELGTPVRTEELAGADLDGALERFLALERAGWKGRAGTALSCRPGDRAFFRAALTSAAGDGDAQIWELRAGDATVASVCAVLSGDGAFHLKTAYDERYGRWSPGLLLEIDIVEAFHHDPRLGWIDSCTAPGPSPSELLYPDRRPIQALVVPLHGPGRAAARALRAVLRGRTAARQRLGGRVGGRR